MSIDMNHMNMKLGKVSNTHILIRLKKYEKPPPEYFLCLVERVSRIVVGEKPLQSTNTVFPPPTKQKSRSLV